MRLIFDFGHLVQIRMWFSNTGEIGGASIEEVLELDRFINFVGISTFWSITYEDLLDNMRKI